MHGATVSSYGDHRIVMSMAIAACLVDSPIVIEGAQAVEKSCLIFSKISKHWGALCMSSSWGNTIKISIFGESHGAAIGVVLDGLPAGIPIDMEDLLSFMDRRRPGKALFATSRKESDTPHILSGYYHGQTTGTPLAIVIQNADTHSTDYKEMEHIARPAHADFTGHLRYRGAQDPRGGGHFSGRLTAPLVAAGGIARQILRPNGIDIGAHIASVGEQHDLLFDPVRLHAEALFSPGKKVFPVLDDIAGEKMQKLIESCRMAQDSVGGVVRMRCYRFSCGNWIPHIRWTGKSNSLLNFWYSCCKRIGIWRRI